MNKIVALIGVKKAVSDAKKWAGMGDIFPYVDTSTGEVWVDCCVGQGNRIVYHKDTIHCLHRYLTVRCLGITMASLKEAAYYYINKSDEVI